MDSGSHTLVNMSTVDEPVTANLPAPVTPPDSVLAGTLHIHVAFDWGEEVQLDEARRLARAEFTLLRRRRRTPSSIAYRPPPLRLSLEPLLVVLPEVGAIEAPAKATIFDFAAVSVAVQVPFELSAVALCRLAGYLAEPAVLVHAARLALEPLYKQILPAIQAPHWSEFSEEYFVFQLPPGERTPTPEQLLGPLAGWLAGIVLLEAGPLSTEEITEALRLHLRYSPDDLFVPNWAAALLVDRDCDETLQTIEFANLQLLEFRQIDTRLDDNQAAAQRLIQPLSGPRLPFWRSHTRAMQTIGELKVEANGLFERTGNVLKLVGDQYLSRVYRLLAARFHLEEWEHSIQRKLEVIEGIYQVLADQAATYRTEVLEGIVIALILVEVLLAVFKH